MTDRALSPPALARILAVKPSKVLGWIDTGELRAVNIAENRTGRPRWKILPEHLNEFLAGRSNEDAPSPRPRRRQRQTGKRVYYR